MRVLQEQLDHVVAERLVLTDRLLNTERRRLQVIKETLRVQARSLSSGDTAAAHRLRRAPGLANRLRRSQGAPQSCVREVREFLTRLEWPTRSRRDAREGVGHMEFDGRSASDHTVDSQYPTIQAVSSS